MKFLRSLFGRTGNKDERPMPEESEKVVEEKEKSWNNNDPSNWRAIFYCGEDPSTFLPPHRQSHYEILYVTSASLREHKVSLDDSIGVSAFMESATKGFVGYATISPSKRIYLGD